MGAPLSPGAADVARAEAACAATETRDAIRAEEARLGAGALEGARLVLLEAEARPARGGLAAALRTFREAGGAARVVPAGFYAGAPRAPEAYAAAWELDALRERSGSGSRVVAAAGAAPFSLEPANGVAGAQRETRACEGWLCHSFAGRKEHAREEVARLVPRSVARVLELGCASGALGALLERGGARVTGVEPDVEAAGRAAARLSRVVAAPVEEAWDELDELDELEGAFDAVVAADVLEHLEEPVAVLRELNARAAPGALLVASLPNAVHASVLAGVLQGRWDRALEGIVAYGHRTYAGRAGWERLLCCGGWEPERVEPLVLHTPSSEAWLPAFAEAGIDDVDTAAHQWLVVARRAEPRGALHLGPSHALGPEVLDPSGHAARGFARGEEAMVFRGALAKEALEALFAGEVVAGAGRRALASGFAPEALAARLEGTSRAVSVVPRGAGPLPGRVLRALAAARRLGLPAVEPCAAEELVVRREAGA